MRARLLLIVSALCILVLGATGVYSENAQNIQTRVIEGFEKPGSWEVKFSKFRSPQFSRKIVGYTHPDAQAAPGRPEDSQSWVSWFQATERDFSFLPDGLPPEVRGRSEKTIMGVRASFEIRGYNWIVVQPKKPLPLEGIVKSLDCWVWGAGYDYDVEFVVRDYHGFYHTLLAGSLTHYGWKNFRVKIPGWIPQKQQWLPKNRPLTFIRFKITAKPFAREDNFHVYFDYMQVQTDIYRERFNGDDLIKLDWKQRGMSSSSQQSGNTGQQGQPAPTTAPQGQGGTGARAPQPPANQ
jgi:hypothetical protein